MERKILFRGKRVDTGEWVQGFFVAYDDETYIFTDEEVKKGIDLGGYLDCCQMHQVIPETVGEWTGLEDRHNTKIFEGDVVAKYDFWLGEIRDTAPRKLVEWAYGSCGFEPFSDSQENCGPCGCGDDPKYVKVVGNIHDNPELVRRYNLATAIC